MCGKGNNFGLLFLHHKKVPTLDTSFQPPQLGKAVSQATPQLFPV